MTTPLRIADTLKDIYCRIENAREHLAMCVETDSSLEESGYVQEVFAALETAQNYLMYLFYQCGERNEDNAPELS